MWTLYTGRSETEGNFSFDDDDEGVLGMFTFWECGVDVGSGRMKMEMRFGGGYRERIRRWKFRDDCV